ncbi:MAG TPA: uracil-DNA glycosylase family protein, partial [Candidatus Binatia bacterium]
MLPVEPPAPVDDREELRMMASALRRHLQWKARAGIRVIAKGRPAGTGPKTMTPINAELFSAAAAAPEARTLEELRDHIGDCRRCKLWSGRTHLVFGVGNPRADVMFVGEGPGRDEDLKGEPFVGRAG